MSFILEALKKTEEKSRRDAGPDLNAAHAVRSGRPRGRQLLSFLLLLALTANALLFLWWLHPWTPDPPASSAAPAAHPVAAVATPPSEPAGPLTISLPADAELQPRPAPAGWNELPSPPAPTAAAASGRGAARKASSAIPWLRELPADVRRQIPELAITLHYYTADPMARLARVNGAIFREGQAISRDLILERITAETIVFRLGETRFRVGEF